MDIHLSPVEARILGCLIEKDLTTPDYYPLSLHALTAASNQKSNRDPVLELPESDVQAALDALIKRGLAAQRADFSARVPKYGHKLSGTLTKTIDFSQPALAIICELLVRGPQTPGELRQRAARMNPFSSVEQVEQTLLGLVTRADGPYVAELPRQPGRRESRYACLFTDVPAPEAVPAAEHSTTTADYDERIRLLEEKVENLTGELHALKQRLGEE